MSAISKSIYLCINLKCMCIAFSLLLFFCLGKPIFLTVHSSELCSLKPGVSVFSVFHPQEKAVRNYYSVGKPTEQLNFSMVIFLSAISDGAPTGIFFLTVKPIFLTVLLLQARCKVW